MPSSPITSVTERRKRNHEAIIEDILRIARDMMLADGVAALSFNAIAHRLGIKPPSLYTYFDRKHAIYDELFRRGFEMFDQAMRARPNRDGTLEERFTSALMTQMRFGLENPDLFQLMFQRPVPGFVPSKRSMQVSLAALERARDELREIVSAGNLSPKVSVEQALDLTISMMYGMTALHLANNPDLPIGEGRFGQLIPPGVQLFLDAWGGNRSDEVKGEQ